MPWNVRNRKHWFVAYYARRKNIIDSEDGLILLRKNIKDKTVIGSKNQPPRHAENANTSKITQRQSKKHTIIFNIGFVVLLTLWSPSPHWYITNHFTRVDNSGKHYMYSYHKLPCGGYDGSFECNQSKQGYRDRYDIIHRPSGSWLFWLVL